MASKTDIKNANSLLYEKMHIKRCMPENYINGELDFCSKEFSYNTLPVELVELHNCFVSDKGFVYEGNFKISERSLLNPSRYVGYFTLKHYLKKVLLRKKRKTNPNNKYLLAFDEWSHDHYHWFCDVLPRIFAIKDILKDFCLLLPGHSSHIREVGLTSLEILGLRPKKIEFIGGKELLVIKNLSIITHACIPGYINDELIRSVRDLFFKKLNFKSEENKRKIYISRETAKYRKVLNENAVLSAMKEYGYEIVNYEKLNLIEQIALTANSKSIVSIHGAGLTNTIFLPPNSSVLEFRRDKIYHNQCYWHLASALGHKYYYLFGEPDNENLVIEGNGCNLTIDVEKLKQLLNNIEINL